MSERTLEDRLGEALRAFDAYRIDPLRPATPWKDVPERFRVSHRRDAKRLVVLARECGISISCKDPSP